MIKPKYLIERLKNIDTTNLKNRVADISSKTGRNKLSVTLDILACGIKYGAGYMDYWLFKFYEKTKKERATYITRSINDSLVRKYNTLDARQYFISKVLFNEKFEKYIGREYLHTKELSYEKFESFIEKHQTVFLKPHDQACGLGIEKVNLADFKNKKEMFEYATNGSFDLVEEPLIQCDKMNEIYPHAINTIRICTLKINEKTQVFYSAIRIGNGGKYVDNYNAGGMAAYVDSKTGIVTNTAIDRTGAIYEEHPMTKTKIVGFQVPKWDECVKLVKQASFVVEDMGYIGWDVCITEKGPVLVEGNDFPGHDIQIPKYSGDKTGFMEIYKEILENSEIGI